MVHAEVLSPARKTFDFPPGGRDAFAGGDGSRTLLVPLESPWLEAPTLGQVAPETKFKGR